MRYECIITRKSSDDDIIVNRVCCAIWNDWIANDRSIYTFKSGWHFLRFYKVSFKKVSRQINLRVSLVDSRLKKIMNLWIYNDLIGIQVSFMKIFIYVLYCSERKKTNCLQQRIKLSSNQFFKNYLIISYIIPIL